MAVVSSPLLSPPPAGRKAPMRKRIAVAVAAVAALAAVATIAGAARQWQLNERRAMLVQAQIASASAQEVPVMAQPVYYVPLSAAQGAGGAPVSKQALAQPRPVVYYYVPESSLKTPHSTVQLADNATAPAAGGANATAAPAVPAFSCTKKNIMDTAKKVLPLWAECTKASDYKEPNKDAKRRLLGWSFSELADNATAAPAGGANASGGNTLADCEGKALGKTCSDISGCPNPVCTSYYNEPEIEALCGVCTMKINMWWGCFARDGSVRLCFIAYNMLAQMLSTIVI
jgi:hypothetical protein